MRRRWLPDTRKFRLPGRPACAVWHAQARRHGEQMCGCALHDANVSHRLRLHTVRRSNVSVGLQEDIVSRKCEQDGCRKFATFGYPGGSRLRCRVHRLEGMVGMLQPCLVTPCWAPFRAAHKYKCSMRGIKCYALQEDVANPGCEESGCRKRASYAYPGGPCVRCSMHRLESMVGSCAAVRCKVGTALTLQCVAARPWWVCRKA